VESEETGKQYLDYFQNGTVITVHTKS